MGDHRPHRQERPSTVTSLEGRERLCDGPPHPKAAEKRRLLVASHADTSTAVGDGMTLGVLSRRPPG